ncbi:DUF4197 domain-containing protein [Hymenobacter chitinivorans]|uniref:Uncharacterized protein DUF4197 n=1 Tax=Hymenobacter chitinivorans DSM 11115 TaxID=1121954 RepID=A0A2M9BQB8_9BACT|nr:DUF4197 domain-containing protein [Hymenobacter chitinivorans]PJJ60154.1 uncharacterized protein DUF4197 [Hymenobacter chitinivorans DSM 11115]
MLRFRILVAALALSLAGTSVAQAQTKTTAKKTTTTKTTAKTPAKTTAKTPVKTTTKTTTKVTTPVVTPPAPLTLPEATTGLREALTQSITRATDIAGSTDGFNANTDIRIPFPPEAELVSTTLRGLRMGALVDNFELALNRGAEAAAAQAKPIFLGAVQNLSFADAMALVTTREPDAATLYLHKNTEPQLVAALTPIVQQSLEQTGATKLYKEMVARYNKIPLVTPINADLTAYAAQKTSDGIFTLMAEEEGRIRLNAAARGSDVLKRAFGK